ncbi:MAG: hypothetical protein KDD12_20485 [Lewinella sp.]|nr:hypothetical protein [Lewinella sp.]
MGVFRYVTIYFLFVFSIASGLSGCRGAKSQAPVAPDRSPLNQETGLEYRYFLDPPNAYRSHPFYSLNDSLTKAELKRQITGFREAGFGGFYLHSRAGLITGYLGAEWWELMDAAVDAANEAGLQCMFYDEDKWPSGFAGGLIPDLGEDYRAKCLARLDLQTALPTGARLLKKDSLYQYIQYTAQYGYDIFNGTCYVDLFNPNAVRKFIESTHQPYFEKYGDKIADNALFIFTDEPHIHARYFDPKTRHHGLLSYSPYLEEKFQQLYGYALRDHLSQLYEEKGNWREVRWHYYMAKALLFEESYTRQIADFCDQYGAQMTGHYLGEDDLKKVRDRIGNSALHYRSMQQPGIDHLGLSIAHRLFTPKYMSSVADQYDKRRRLSELFGISGQNVDFQERKWVGGWHALLGVNHFCPHLTAYSLKGARKRDYPPTFSYQQPYWDYNKLMEDYLGRISYAATAGHFDPQVLVVSPLESEYVKGDREGAFTDGMVQILEALQNNHIDFNLGDEEIIRDRGSVADNQFVIGAMQYRYVILPEMLTIRQSTLSLLLRFHANGGTLFSMGSLPRFVDAKADPTALDALKKAVIPISVEAMEVNPEKYIPPAVRISGAQAGQVWVQRRKINGEPFYLFYNTSDFTQAGITLQLPADRKNPVLWDPAKPGVYRLPAAENGAINITLEPAGFYWVTTGTLSEGIPAKPLPPTPALKPLLTLDGPWTGKRNAPNVLALDFAAYSTDGGKTFSDPEPVIGIWSRLNDAQYNGDLRLRFSAIIRQVPGHCALAMEQPRAFQQILINGSPVQFSGEAYYIDQSIKTRDISRLLREGRNEIELQIAFSACDPLSSDPARRYETELETIYLTGDFGVFSDQVQTVENTQRNLSEDLVRRPAYAFENFFIDREKDRFDGNATLEGYPFYAGSFTLSNSFEFGSPDSGKNYYLDLSACDATVIEVIVNDRRVDTLCWAPYTVDITNYLKKGTNTLQLNLVNSLRNLLGPHHHKGAELIKVGPNSFTGAGGFPDGRGEPDWYDLRKQKTDLAIWTDTYYQVPFGVLGKVVVLSN